MSGIDRPWAMVDNITGVPIPDDFYPTPPECLDALLPHIRDFPRDIWEPACGNGALSLVLEREGFRVVSTDLIDYGFGIPRRNFLTEEKALAPAVLTNPPFGASRSRLPERFVRHAFKLGVSHLALKLKGDYLCPFHGGLFEQFPPSKIHPLTWRPDFTGKGKNIMWIVWRPGDTSARRLHNPNKVNRGSRKNAA